MTEEPPRPQPQWWQPQSQGPQGPPPPAAQPTAPLGQPAWQSPAPQAPPPPAWQQPGPQDPPPPAWQAQGAYGPIPVSPVIRRRRRRWPWITLLVIVVFLVAADRVALVLTENAMATNFQQSVGLSGKPHVVIQGIPFLTQLAARDFRTVDINATNETTAEGTLEIASLTATLHGMHIRSLNSATIDQFYASALVTFAALGSAGGVPQGITLSMAGPNTIQATVDIGPITDSATAQVTQVGTNKVNIHVTDFGGIPASVLGNMVDFTISLPKLPAGVSIQSVSITQQGLRIIITGQHTTLSQNP